MKFATLLKSNIKIARYFSDPTPTAKRHIIEGYISTYMSMLVKDYTIAYIAYDHDDVLEYLSELRDSPVVLIYYTYAPMREKTIDLIKSLITRNNLVIIQCPIEPNIDCVCFYANLYKVRNKKLII